MTVSLRFAVILSLSITVFVGLPAAARAQGTAHSLVGTVLRNVVTLTWQAPVTPTAPVIGYRIDSGPAPGVTAFSFPLGNVQTLSTPAPDGVYFVRVQALTAMGPAGPSNEVQVAVGQAAPPLPPVMLTGSAGGGQVALQWMENPAGPTISGYMVEGGSGPGLANLGTVRLPAATRTLSAPVPPGTYYARVRAVNAAGLSGPSNEVTLVAEAGSCVPGPPRTLTATTAPGSVRFAWAAPGAGGPPTGYRLDVGSVSGATNLASAPLPLGTSFTTGAPAGRYFVRLVATNACGASPPSNEVVVDIPSGVVVPSLRGTWDGLVFNHPGSFGYGPITNFTITFTGEPSGITPIGVWTDNLGCRNSLVVALFSRGAFIISSESLRCNDGDFTMTVTSATATTLQGTCRGNCTFRMTKR